MKEILGLLWKLFSSLMALIMLGFGCWHGYHGNYTLATYELLWVVIISPRSEVSR